MISFHNLFPKITTCPSLLDKMPYQLNYNPEADPGFPVGGGGPILWGCIDLQHGHFSVKMYVKKKKLRPIGGMRVPENFVCRSTNEL